INYNIVNNSELRKLLTATSSRSIIVIEDIDCSVDLTGKRRKRDGDLSAKKDGGQGKEDQNQSRVTLSGLLNFIDGIWSACGQERIIIFTTNHIEKLDPALIRRGRMDMHIELSYCGFEAFKVLAKNYLDVDSHPLFGEIKSLLKETKIAPADVAEKLMAKNHKIDVDGSLKDLVESLERRKKHQRDHGDDHKKKIGGKKLGIFRGLF
ncbi:AAA-ATPase At3g28610, partial [Brassica rapa]|uniref:AAA-ATPase At3g28610 n=1 Tax=Brassica campestris TaxID=3711 RepID=UPI00142D4BA4